MREILMSDLLTDVPMQEEKEITWMIEVDLFFLDRGEVKEQLIKEAGQ